MNHELPQLWFHTLEMDPAPRILAMLFLLEEVSKNGCEFFLSETIELGAGDKKVNTHLALDLRRIEGVTDIVATVSALPFRPNVFFFMRAADVLEHVGWQQILPTLEEWKRTLASGGIIFIKTPNMQTLCKAYLETYFSNSLGFPSNIGPRMLIIRKIFGAQSYPGNAHLGGTDPDTLRAMLEALGFSNVTITPQGAGGDYFNMICVAKK